MKLDLTGFTVMGNLDIYYPIVACKDGYIHPNARYTIFKINCIIHTFFPTLHAPGK
jgi:hypothetical protein